MGGGEIPLKKTIIDFEIKRNDKLKYIKRLINFNWGKGSDWGDTGFTNVVILSYKDRAKNYPLHKSFNAWHIR